MAEVPKVPANVGPLAHAIWEQLLIKGPILPSFTDATRGAPEIPGRIIWNSDDNFINVADGTNWRKAGGGIT